MVNEELLTVLTFQLTVLTYGRQQQLSNSCWPPRQLLSGNGETTVDSEGGGWGEDRGQDGDHQPATGHFRNGSDQNYPYQVSVEKRVFAGLLIPFSYF
jgi:hypothetical protein